MLARGQRGDALSSRHFLARTDTETPKPYSTKFELGILGSPENRSACCVPNDGSHPPRAPSGANAALYGRSEACHLV